MSIVDKLDMEAVFKAATEKHRDYLENDNVPPEQMKLELEQHEKNLCFATCFFCKLEKTATKEVLRQLVEQSD